MKKIHLKKRKIKKKNSINLIIIIFIFLSIFVYKVINYIDKNIVPILTSYASSEVRKFSNMIINRAVSKHINEELDIEKMFIITKDDVGNIKTIDFDPIIINKTLNKIVDTIQLNLKYLENGNLEMLELPDDVLVDYNKEKLLKGIIYEIPSGIVLKNSLLANLGPKIPVKFSLIGDIVSNIKTKVTNYGINNALIQVSINIEIESLVILPLISDTIKVKTDIPIAMKLIQGSVPSYLVGDSSSYPIKIPN